MSSPENTETSCMDCGATAPVMSPMTHKPNCPTKQGDRVVATRKCLATVFGNCSRDLACEGQCIHEPAQSTRDPRPSEAEIMAERANPKDIAGRGKPHMGLVPVGSMECLARVMELGANKYGPYNWRAEPIKNMVYANAALRHLYAWIGGQSVDPESGQSHLAHVASCMMIVLDAEKNNTVIEDRVWLPSAKPEGPALNRTRDVSYRWSDSI